MRYLMIGLVGLGGLGLAAQAAVNSRLRLSVGSPAASALISFAVGGVALALLTLSGWLGRGRWADLGTAPWWAWVGGLFGAFYVTISIIALPRIGTALVVAGGVSGQMIASLAMDAFGWLGVPRVPLSGTRVAGALLLLAGVALLQRR